MSDTRPTAAQAERNRIADPAEPLLERASAGGIKKPTAAQIQMQREELTALVLNYCRLTGVTPSTYQKDIRSEGSFTRMVISQVLGMKPERVRDWFYRNPVPELALVAMRQALQIKRLEQQIAALTDNTGMSGDTVAAE